VKPHRIREAEWTFGDHVHGDNSTQLRGVVVALDPDGDLRVGSAPTQFSRVSTSTIIPRAVLVRLLTQAGWTLTPPESMTPTASEPDPDIGDPPPEHVHFSDD
jgi:hypothetical protein